MGNCVHRFYYYLGVIRSTDQEIKLIHKRRLKQENAKGIEWHPHGTGPRDLNSINKLIHCLN